MTDDPFGTAGVRDQVLAGWSASPDRFREDANAEEDLALGGYRDRLVVELAQNAADAAARAGVPGRLLLRLARTDDGALLVAANTGSPLDAGGVRGLATLRASAKRDADPVATVGRFGVGFAAVLAVTDEPAVVSHGRGVRFSRGDTLSLVREASATVPQLALELERRDDHVPVLRLPFPADGAAPAGYDTAVLLPLRDGAATDLAEHLLTEVDDALLLALPGLEEVVVELGESAPRRLTGVAERWCGVRREGVHPPEVLADRPTEERERAGWAVTWALPRTPGGVPRVLHAPTPTDEPLDWPALLVATFPLDPSRRHVAPGPATTALVAHCAAAYADLLADRAQAGDDVLSLVPTGLPAGGLDAELRAAVLAHLPEVPLLRSAEDGALLRPRDAVALEGPAGEDRSALEVLAPVVAGLVASPRGSAAALRALSVRTLSLADVVDQLPADASASRSAQRYAGLAGLAAEAAGREALAALPVPLADGRVVRGVRGACLLSSGLDSDPDAALLGALAPFGLRVVHPEAAGTPAAARLLERLGARPAGTRELLDEPAVRAAVEAAADDPDDEGVDGVVDAVLALVRSAVRGGDLAPGDLAWLGDLPLEAADGDLAPAAELVLPGSPAAAVLEPDEVVAVADDVVREWGAEVLEAVGVARALGVLRASDVDPDDLPEELDALDGARAWARTLPAGTVAEVVALRDLDLVREAAWPHVLELLATERHLRAAVTSPVVVRAPDGTAHRAVPYAAWWLRTRLGLAAHADPDADPALAALLPPAPRWVAAADPGLRAALGLARDLDALDEDGWAAVLQRLREPRVPEAALLAVWRGLAGAALSGRVRRVDPPAQLRVPTPQGVVVVPPDEVAVVDAPMWLQRPDAGALLAVPAVAAEALADLLDLDLASERASGHVAGAGAQEPVPEVVHELLPGCPRTWWEHDELTVDGVDVEWWVSGEGPEAVVRAVTVAGLARGLAQAAGSWGRRLAVEALLVGPAASRLVLLEEALAADG